MQNAAREALNAERSVTLQLVVAFLSSLAVLAGGACSTAEEPAATGGGSIQGKGGDSSGVSGFGHGNAPPDPETCEQAAEAKSYIGCEFYPTVTANVVMSIFDYAVVVANVSSEASDVSIDRGGTLVADATVPPGDLRIFYLPWVPELKGPDLPRCEGFHGALDATVRLTDGAYHLVSTLPVAVYQFNPLEYSSQGGPPGKNWSACTELSSCKDTECLSYSNDASLLLPTTALGRSYRVTGYAGDGRLPPYVSITGTRDGTKVDVSLSATAALLPGSDVPATEAYGKVSFSLNKGETMQLMGTPYADLSGSLIESDEPVQVIHGMSCAGIPWGTCDHLEESVLPAETLGRHYVLAAPTAPKGGVAEGQVVRIYGNVDDTHLWYPSGKPLGFPDRIDAGQVVEVRQLAQPALEECEVVGDHEFAVATFQLTSLFVNDGSSSATLGDPAQSVAVPIEQYRRKYIFLAPSDYSVSYVDVIQPLQATITLDGKALNIVPAPIGASTYGVARVKLGIGTSAHVLYASEPVGIQVIGYGLYTSYQYPGGLNLGQIAAPPIK